MRRGNGQPARIDDHGLVGEDQALDIPKKIAPVVAQRETAVVGDLKEPVAIRVRENGGRIGRISNRQRITLDAVVLESASEVGRIGIGEAVVSIVIADHTRDAQLAGIDHTSEHGTHDIAHAFNNRSRLSCGKRSSCIVSRSLRRAHQESRSIGSGSSVIPSHIRSVCRSVRSQEGLEGLSRCVRRRIRRSLRRGGCRSAGGCSVCRVSGSRVIRNRRRPRSRCSRRSARRGTRISLGRGSGRESVQVSHEGSGRRRHGVSRERGDQRRIRQGGDGIGRRSLSGVRSSLGRSSSLGRREGGRG